MSSLAEHQYQQALAAVEHSDAADAEKAEMLMQIAMGLQQRPREPRELLDAIELYDRAIALSDDDPLLGARIRARKATAMQAVPDDDPQRLHHALDELRTALPVLEQQGNEQEVAEAYLNLGLITQCLAASGQAPITDAIAHYQRALRGFTRERHPAEYAIVHNNLAAAFLSIPMTDERARMREALAVQSFEAALEVVNLVDQPAEYAMLQNNLGNALQYASSSHMLENNLRALEAYDEALRVRTRKDSPLEYAGTIANKANCLRNLPDDPAEPQRGNRRRLMEASALYREALEILLEHGDSARADAIREALSEIDAEIANDATDAAARRLQ